MASLEVPGTSIPTHAIRRNPHNPRRYFNEASLDTLKNSIQEVGILVPLIVYADPDNAGEYVLLDGERRWNSAVELGLETVPVNVIETPSTLDNLLRMFNIHAVREDWPLVSIAMSLQDVIMISGETRETRLADMTGLTRSTVRRAKRLLSLPEQEIELIRADAHLDRSDQVHREDLYLEIEAADSVIRNNFPEMQEEYGRPQIIRQFARKREEGHLRAVTEWRDVGKTLQVVKDGLVERDRVRPHLDRLIGDVEYTPSQMYEEVASVAFAQRDIGRKAEGLLAAILEYVSETDSSVPKRVRETLLELRDALDEVLRT